MPKSVLQLGDSAAALSDDGRGRGDAVGRGGSATSTMHSVPGADLSDWDDYEINLDQRVLSPEICMASRLHAWPAGRLAGGDS
jgi:hypothetical protein